MRGYTVEALEAQAWTVWKSPPLAKRTRILRTYLRPVAGSVLSASVQPEDITAFFLAIHARGGQLGTFITNAPFSDEAYDEFIRCLNQIPEHSGWTWYPAMSCRTAPLPTASAWLRATNGLLELKRRILRHLAAF